MLYAHPKIHLHTMKVYITRPSQFYEILPSKKKILPS